MSGPTVDVSVVIPFHRGAETIARAIRSIEAQTRRPREILIVDDGSPQPLPELASHVPLRVLRHPENRGIPAARNTGIRAAAGAWIGFLDQDDEWVPDKLERQSTSTEANGAVFGRLLHTGAGRAPWIWPPLRAVGRLEAGGERAMGAILRWGNAAPIVTLLIARATFERLGPLDESLRGGSDDFEYLLRLIAEDAPLRYDGGGKGRYSAVHHFTGANYSGHAPRFLEDDLRLVQSLGERYPLIARYRDRLMARTEYTYGRHHDRAGEVAEARRRYALAAALDPLWPKPRLAAAWLALPQQLRDHASSVRERVRGRVTQRS